ncbi:ABC transporter substrate-binding protein [Yinghuangia sp. YIM S10712]|uniref:ABC transporter substrate-binding protein n=1 Tax=Yinghuangia sp. YIM S10712 TaxID=3436930 RepID=UPI003F5379BE
MNHRTLGDRIPRIPRQGAPLSRRHFLMASLAAGVPIAGCADSDPAPDPEGTPRSGGSLTLTLPGDAASFDPALTSFVNVADGNRMAAVYGSLVYTNPSTGSVQPQIAESLVADRTGQHWTLTLRDGVKFSDGARYDAAAVKANWVRHQDRSIGSYQAAAVLNITSLDVDPANPLVLRIGLASPNANFDRTVARNLSYNASPNSLGPENVASLRDKPVGAGPFLLKQWTPGQPQTYVRNPDYWQKSQGLPYLDELVIRFDIDVQRGVESLGKTSDLTITIDPENIARGRSQGLGVEELRLNGGAMVLFNTAQPPFDDPRARRAVALALDSGEINEKFYAGAGTPAKGIFSATSPLANIQLTAPQNDPAQAARLFDEVTANGAKPLEFTYIAPSAPTTVAVAGFIRQKLGQYRGVSMQIEEVDIATYIRKVRKGAPGWTAAVGQQWIEDPEPGIYDLLHSKSFSASSGYRNPVVDAALDQARQSIDAARRRNAYTQVQVELNKDLPFWVYQEAIAAAVFTSDVTGLSLFNDGLVHWDRIGLRN